MARPGARVCLTCSEGGQRPSGNLAAINWHVLWTDSSGAWDGQKLGVVVAFKLCVLKVVPKSRCKSRANVGLFFWWLAVVLCVAGRPSSSARNFETARGLGAEDVRGNYTPCVIQCE